MKAALAALNGLTDISDADKAAARACLERAKHADMSTWVYNLTAPLVMLLVLPFVKRDANKLPSLFSKWDNNISMNGDSGGVWIPAGHPEFIRYASVGEGVWVDYHDVLDWEAVQGCLMVTYDDPRFTGTAYYARGHHPRSWWARYLWLGWRNRASQLSIDVGVPVTAPIELISGDADVCTSRPGHFLLRSGDTFHFKIVDKVRLLGRDFARIRSVGFKLEIARKSPAEAARVAAVYIPWSLKKWAGA